MRTETGIFFMSFLGYLFPSFISLDIPDFIVARLSLELVAI